MSNYNRVNYGIISRTPRTTFTSPELDKILSEKAQIECALELIRIQKKKAEIQEQLDTHRAIEVSREKVGFNPSTFENIIGKAESDLNRAIELSIIQKEKDEILKELVKRTVVLDYETDSDDENDETPKPKTIIDKVIVNNQQKIDILIKLEKLYAKKGWIIPLGLRMYSLDKLNAHFKKHNTD